MSYWSSPRKKIRPSRPVSRIGVLRPTNHARPRLETFEQRILLDCTTIPHPFYAGDYADVCTTADTGPHSLRDAINYVNTLPPPPNPPGHYTIAFDIQALGTQTIHLRSPLPPLNVTVAIDATTQCYSLSPSCTPYVDRPVIELDGSGAGANANGFTNNSGSIIAGFAINNFSSSAILVQRTSNAQVLLNYIGTDPLGTSVRANRAGITVSAGGDSSLIAGNLISGNRDAGIILQQASQLAVISANLIGTDFRGLFSVANNNGIVLASGTAFNTIGGSSPSDANIISGNRQDGILIRDRDTSDNTIVGNRIGTNINGTADLGSFNNLTGIDLVGEPIRTFPTNTRIYNNQISGNLGAGIQLSHSTQGNDIWNNLIGTNAAGTSALPNGQSGIALLDVDHNTVGGGTDSERNIISGNTNEGILLTAGANQNSILGNYIGINRAGTGPVANGIGIFLQAAANNFIGDAIAGVGNVISGNRIAGITLTSNQTANNQIVSNLIGLNAAGTLAVANNVGIMLSQSASNNTIGGVDFSARNVISGNATSGILISDDVTGTQIQGNLIGTNPAGTAPIPNRTTGVSIVRASGNFIGGQSPNLIGFNGTDGVLVNTGVYNTISQNSIFSSTGLGIRLINGGNQMLPFPSIDSAVTVTSDPSITIAGSYSGAPNSDFSVEFFTNSVCNPSGFGEGEQFIGLVGITTDSAGNADISATFSVAVDPGQFITATATDGLGNTSQFSACTQVTDGGPSGAPNAGRNGRLIARERADYPQQTSPNGEIQTANSFLQHPSLSRQDIDLFFTNVQASSSSAQLIKDSIPPDLFSSMNWKEISLSEADANLFQWNQQLEL